jgi:hypothetical protein
MSEDFEKEQELMKLLALKEPESINMGTQTERIGNDDEEERLEGRLFVK